MRGHKRRFYRHCLRKAAADDGDHGWGVRRLRRLHGQRRATEIEQQLFEESWAELRHRHVYEASDQFEAQLRRVSRPDSAALASSSLNCRHLRRLWSTRTAYYGTVDGLRRREHEVFGGPGLRGQRLHRSDHVGRNVWKMVADGINWCGGLESGGDRLAGYLLCSAGGIHPRWKSIVWMKNPSTSHADDRTSFQEKHVAGYANFHSVPTAPPTRSSCRSPTSRRCGTVRKSRRYRPTWPARSSTNGGLRTLDT